MKKLLMKTKNCIIECSKNILDHAEVDTLKGDASKAKRLLNWNQFIISNL